MSGHRPSLRTGAGRCCGPICGWFLALEVIAAIALFAGTLALDRAAYRGAVGLPAWVISGTADAARQILTAIAAAVITVVGVVFSITW